MKRKIILTADGSPSLEVEGWGEHYHSKHGAIQEAYHVFIRNGLELFPQQNLHILEIGLGTGLNAFITFLEHQRLSQNIVYQGVEAYPLREEEFRLLNYPELLNAREHQTIFEKIHLSPWEETLALSADFSLQKRKMFFEEIEQENAFDLIYFDAFGARVQPELWEEPIFKKMYKALKNNGILVTYASKASAQRAMQSVGFQVEKLPGPPGKREMLRAKKILP